MERFGFGSDVAFTPSEELLEGVTVAPLSRSISDGSPFRAAIFRLAPGGRIARHPASCPQILAVLEGSGDVSGASGIDEPSPPAKQSSGRKARSTRRSRQPGSRR